MNEPRKDTTDLKINLPGVIQVILPNTPFEEVERCREIIHTLFLSDFFKIKNGKATVHFDHLGIVQQIGVDSIRWKKGKDLLQPIDNDRIKVQLNTLIQTKEGAAK